MPVTPSTSELTQEVLKLRRERERLVAAAERQRDTISDLQFSASLRDQELLALRKRLSL